MGNSIPRRQHYIPEMLLKNFCDDRLWVGYDGKVFKTTIGNAFVENNLYTKADYRHAPKGVGYEGFLRSITKSYEYEERLSEVESIAEPAVRRILNRARIGKRPKLPTRLALAWKQFLFAMARRTPESQERISPTKSPEDVFYQAALQGTNGDNLPLPAKESFYGSPRVAELQKMVMSNINARFAAGDHPRLASENRKVLRRNRLVRCYCPYAEEKLRHWKPWSGYCRIRT